MVGVLSTIPRQVCVQWSAHGNGDVQQHQWVREVVEKENWGVWKEEMVDQDVEVTGVMQEQWVCDNVVCHLHQLPRKAAQEQVVAQEANQQMDAVEHWDIA